MAHSSVVYWDRSPLSPQLQEAAIDQSAPAPGYAPVAECSVDLVAFTDGRFSPTGLLTRPPPGPRLAYLGPPSIFRILGVCARPAGAAAWRLLAECDASLQVLAAPFGCPYAALNAF